MDHFTETSRTSYGQNIGNSFKGIFVGFLLIIGSIILLWWNEGRSVEMTEALGEMQQQIVTLPDSKYDAKYEGKAVLVQGLVTPLNAVVDPEFGVQTDALVLRKNVQMYQWKENTSTKTEEKLGGATETTTTYDYVKEWSSFATDSSSFKHPEGHHNPAMHHKSQTYVTDAQLGGYHLDRSMVGQISASQTYTGLASLPEEIGVARNYHSFLYIGYAPDRPEIGDVKITYSYAPSAVYTYAAKAQAQSLVPYVTTNGKSFVFVRSGKIASQVIFQEELDANSMMTWILRGVGLLLMFIGFSMVMGPLATFAKVIPALGSLVGGVTGIIAGVLTLILGSIVIALAWFGSRPLLSLGIIGTGVVIAVVMAKMGKRKEGTPTTTSTPPPRASTPPPRTQAEEAEDSTAEQATPPPRNTPPKEQSGATPPPREA